jgi:hypothetical protein
VSAAGRLDTQLIVKAREILSNRHNIGKAVAFAGLTIPGKLLNIEAMYAQAAPPARSGLGCDAEGY